MVFGYMRTPFVIELTFISLPLRLSRSSKQLSTFSELSASLYRSYVIPTER
jgi:hypothetical protein